MAVRGRRAEETSPRLDAEAGTPPPTLIRRQMSESKLGTRRSRTAMLCGSLAGLITVANLVSIIPLLRSQSSQLVRLRASRCCQPWASALRHACCPARARAARAYGTPAL